MDSWVKKMGGHIICQGQKGAIGKNVQIGKVYKLNV